MEEAPVPASESEITTGWLTRILRGHQARASVERRTLARIGVGYGLSSELYRVEIVGRDCPRSIVVKLWATDGVAGTREVDFYRELGAGAGIRLPACYHGRVDPDRRRGVLALEEVLDAEQGDCLATPDLEQATALARVVARFHRRWWDDERLRAAAWLPSIRERWRGAAWFADRRPRFLVRFGRRLDPVCLRLIEAIEAVEVRANALLAELPETLLHADVHLDNVMFPSGGTAPILLDWARVARGPGVIDLGEIVFGMGRVKDMDTILGAHLDELHRNGLETVGEPAIRRGLSGVVLRRFIASTLGAVEWNAASRREEEMIDLGIERAQDALLTWLSRDPTRTLAELVQSG